MSEREADARFLLPTRPASAEVVGDLDGWTGGLAAAGVREERGEGPHLVVTSRALVDDALARDPDLLIVSGRGRKARLPRGWFVRRYLPIPSAGPTLWLPLDARGASRYAFERWFASPNRWKQLRNRAARALLRSPGARSLPTVDIAARVDPVPWFVTAAHERLYGGQPHSWLTTTAPGASKDYRGVFHLFEAGAVEPSWIVKFARAEHLSAPFDRDERGLALAASAGDLVAEHAPVFVASLEAEGLRASIETAAVGERMGSWLQSSRPARVKMEWVDRIARWIVRVSETTAAPGALGDERARLARDVVPLWEEFGAPAGLVGRIPDVPAVLQHNDLWSENVILDVADFRVIDWEDARAAGLPLWDLVYFLSDALARVDGAIDDDARREHFVALFAGRCAASGLLFDWVDRGAGVLGIPAEAVGPIVTSCWLSLVLAHVTRGEDARRFEQHGLSKLPPGAFWGHLWLGDERLGPEWPAWTSRS